MEYITAAELAREWGVTPRYVQRLLSEGRIPGAFLSQRRWQVPADSVRPVAFRKDSSYIICGLVSAALSLPGGVPDSAPDYLRAQYAAELCYLRGDFDAVKAYFAGLSPDNPAYFCAADIAIAAAMSTRDYPLFTRIRAAVRESMDESSGEDAVKGAAMFEAFTAVCMNAPEMTPEWLKSGAFFDFPDESRRFLVFLRVKYLQSCRRYGEMLGTARTALDLRPREEAFTLTDIYHLVLCACASYALGRMEDTAAYLEKSVAVCVMGGFVAPLSEYAAGVGGLLQAALKTAPPEFERRVVAQINDNLKNWIFFHTEFTRDNASLILTSREYQLAVLLKEGKTYRQAASQLRLSPGRVKNIVSDIYYKLGITRKSEIGGFVY